MRTSTSNNSSLRNSPIVTAPPTHIRRFRSLRSKNRNQSPYEQTSASILVLSGSQLEIQHTTSVSVETSRNPRYKPSHSLTSLSAQHLAPSNTPRSALTSPIQLRSAITSPIRTPARSPNYIHEHNDKDSYNYSVGQSPPKFPEPQLRQKLFDKDSVFVNGLAAHPISLSSLQKSNGNSAQPQKPTLPAVKSTPRPRSQTLPSARRPNNPIQNPRHNHRRVRINKSTSDLNLPRENTLRLFPVQRGVPASIDSRRTPRNLNQPSQPFKPCLGMHTMSSRTPANVALSHEISPPSSPDLAPKTKGSRPPRDVSPLDSSDDMATRQKPRTAAIDHGNIPAMRRERKTRALRAASSRDQMSQPASKEVGRQVFRMAEGRDMRWDAMTGEPTLGPGRSAQVKPAEYAQGISKSPNSKPQTSASQAQPDSNTPSQIAMSKLRGPLTHNLKANNMRSVSQPSQIQPQVRGQEQEHEQKQPQLTEPQPRPAWKGGSGRTSILDPVRDNNTGMKARRNVSVSGVTSPVRSETGGAVPIIRKMAPSKPRGQTTPLSSPKSPSDAQVIDYPTPPRTIERDPLQKQSQTQTETKAQNQTHQHSSSVSGMQTRNLSRHISTDLISNKSIRRKPTPSAVSIQSTTQAETREPTRAPTHEPVHDPTDQPAWAQPTSRFSVTTVATSVYSLSPELGPMGRDEPIPEIPASLKQLSEAAPIYPESSSQRKFSGSRHKDTEEERNMGFNIDFQPVWTPSPARDNVKQASALSPVISPLNLSHNQSVFTSVNKPIPRSMAMGQLFNNDTISIHTSGPGGKALPPAPPETSAGDRVAHLNALLEALANRRININRSIAKMTEMMPRDNLMARPEVLKKRELEKNKVQALENELAEVRREEYEVGIKLHRARKRQDRDANFEGNSTLWVKRALE
ncbi:uncharacterized protein BROUX77_000337 [Berkeleyomyces rouxiae]|uniref:uncharacterized protein n=1 Tax=Berkeleyomyces rouxiae TaxID=2035830 RepID=UPI003B8049C3